MTRSERPALARRLLGGLRRWILTDRALKTALAAGGSWWVGTLVPGNPHPYFAPLAAILTVQITVAESVARAIERTAGVVVGVGLAWSLSRALGLNAVSIGLLVLAALAVGTALRLGPQGVSQVAISALLVMIVGSLRAPGYAWSRVVESAIGAVVGVGVSALLVPPSGLPDAEAALATLAEGLAALLDQLAEELAAPDRDSALRGQKVRSPQSPSEGFMGPPGRRAMEGTGPARPRAASAGGSHPAGPGAGDAGWLRSARRVDRGAQAAADALARAEESLRYNLVARRQHGRLARLRGAFTALEHAAIQVRGIARCLDDAASGAGGSEPGAAAASDAVGSGRRGTITAGPELAPLLRALGAGLSAFWRTVVEAAPGARRTWEAARREAVAACARAEAELAGRGDWVPLGSILADARKMAADLEAATGRLGGSPP